MESVIKHYSPSRSSGSQQNTIKGFMDYAEAEMDMKGEDIQKMNQAYELFCRIHPKRKTATSLGKGLGISPVRSQSQNNEVAKDRFQVEAENSLDFDSFNELMSSIMLHEDGIGKVQQQQTKPIPMIQLQNFAKRKTSDPGLNYYHKYPDIKSIV